MRHFALLAGHALLLCGAMSAGVCSVGMSMAQPMVVVSHEVEASTFGVQPTMPFERPLPTAPQLLVAERRRKTLSEVEIIYSMRDDLDEPRPFKQSRNRYNRKHHRAARNGWRR